MTERPAFLSMPSRSDKPRNTGVTHVLDKGMPLDELRAKMPSVAEYIDVWKFGWGTAYLDPEVDEKIDVLLAHGIRPCPGGTLLEIAWLQHRSAEFFKWVRSVGFPAVEVSNGATALPMDEKHTLIRTARELGFTVFAEVGSKFATHAATPERWVEEIRRDIEAGADWIVAEGRESGTVGLYEANGQVRTQLVEAIESAADGARIIYEAPQRSQQSWLIRSVGPQVNIGNVTLTEVMSVESLRRGLRADTIGIGASQCSGTPG